MAKIKSIKDLDKLIKPYIEKAMILTRDEITEIIQKHVDEYYEEKFFIQNSPQNKPYSYQRTDEFKNALKEKHPVKYSNGKFSFRVGFPESYLDFVYDGGATGFDVLGLASEGAHGGIYGNSTKDFIGVPTNDKYGDGNVFFWNDAMIEIEQKYGSLSQLFISNCRKVGLPIK